MFCQLNVMYRLCVAAEVTSSGSLRLDGYDIAVVYFRAGYTPDDYPSEAEWEARETVCCSRKLSVESGSLKDASSSLQVN